MGGGHPSFLRGAGRARAQGPQAVSTPASGASGLLTALERGPLSFVCAPYPRSAPAQVLEPPLCLGSHTHGSPEGAGEGLAPLGVLRTPGTAAPAVRSPPALLPRNGPLAPPTCACFPPCVYGGGAVGVPPAGRRCSDEVALLCFEEQCNDIVKASGTSLGDPFPHTATSLPQRPRTCTPSPPPCPARSLLHGNLRSWPGLGLWGQRAPFPQAEAPPQWACIPGLRSRPPPGEALAGLPDTLSLLHYCAPLASSAMMKGHRSGPARRPPRLGRESGHLTPLTSKETQVRSWAGGRSIGGSEPQSGEVLSQPLHLGCGWTGAGADSENLWLEKDLCNQLPGRTRGSRLDQDPVDKEAHCFAWRVGLGLVQTEFPLP